MKNIIEIIEDLQKRGYSSNTLKQYKRIMLKFLTFSASKKYAVGPESAALFVSKQINNMKNTSISALKQYFMYNHIDFDTNNLRYKRLLTIKPILERSQALMYLSYAKAHYTALYPLLVLLYGSGLRISEAVSLHSRDISGNKLTVQSKGRQRIIPLSPRFMPYVQSNQYQFLGSFSKDYYIRRYQEKIHNCSKEMNMSHITAHSFRHTFAVHMLQKGYNIKQLQLLLGHSSIETTSKYLDYTDISKVRAIY